MSGKERRFRFFYEAYPTPHDLASPLEDVKSSYLYDYFANFHVTYNGRQICIRCKRGGYFSVSVRGWIPPEFGYKPFSYDKCWTDIAVVDTFVAARRLFVRFLRELLSLPDDILEEFSSLPDYLDGLI